MATAPNVPDFTQYNFDLGDTTAVVTKQNGVNQALADFGAELQTMVASINNDLATINSALPILELFTEFTTSGTLNIDPDARWLYIETVGGGGAGGKADSAEIGGGGGGGYASQLWRASDLEHSSYDVMIGSGGPGISSASGPGPVGGTTSVLNVNTPGQILCRGTGGRGGDSAAGGSGGNLTAQARSSSNPFSAIGAGSYGCGGGGYGDGGNLSRGGNCNFGGAGGGGAGASSSGNGGKALAQFNMSPAGQLGSGGDGSATGNGSDGDFPGGGGGASSFQGATSGAGASGRVRVWQW